MLFISISVLIIDLKPRNTASTGNKTLHYLALRGFKNLGQTNRRYFDKTDIYSSSVSMENNTTLIVWERPRTSNSLIYIIIEDVDSDTQNEIIALGSSWEYNYYIYWILVYENNSGTYTLSASTKALIQDREDIKYSGLMTVIDYDNNGQKDILFLKRYPRGDYHDSYIYVYEYNSYGLTNVFNQQLRNYETYSATKICGGDVDGDGVDELVEVGTYLDDPSWGDYRTYIAIWQYNGSAFVKEVQTNWALADPTYCSGCGIYDVDADGDIEIVVRSHYSSQPWTYWYLYHRILRWDGTTLTTEASHSYGSPLGYRIEGVGSDVEFFDVDGDGVVEIVSPFLTANTTENSNNIYRAGIAIYNHNGSALTMEAATNWREPNANDNSIRTVAFKDIDNDTDMEIIALGYYRNISQNKIWYMSEVFMHNGLSIDYEGKYELATAPLGSRMIFYASITIGETIFIAGFNSTSPYTKRNTGVIEIHNNTKVAFYWKRPNVIVHIRDSYIYDADGDDNEEMVCLGISYEYDYRHLWVLVFENYTQYPELTVEEELRSTPRDESETYYLRIIDYDGDGRQEILLIWVYGSQPWTIEMSVLEYDSGALTYLYNQTLRNAEYYSGGHFYVADLDMDGVQELVEVGTLIAVPGWGDLRTYVAIWSFDGTQFSLEAETNWSKADPTYGSGLYIGDIDVDGEIEILVQSNYASQPWTQWYYYVRVMTYDGSSFYLESDASWTLKYAEVSGGYYTHIIQTDIDSDGVDEIITYMRERNASNVYWGAILILNYNGSNINLEYEYVWENIRWAGSSLYYFLRYDYDLDGDDELIFSGSYKIGDFWYGDIQQHYYDGTTMNYETSIQLFNTTSYIYCYKLFLHSDYIVFCGQNTTRSWGTTGLIKIELTPDSDNDGLSNSLEAQIGTDPWDPDTDDDGLTDSEEYIIHNTDPLNWDSDYDGMSDGWEVGYGLDPLDASDASGDVDGDGLSNLGEYQNGTDPLDSDTDDDGFEDGYEIEHGTDPLDPNDYPIETSTETSEETPTTIGREFLWFYVAIVFVLVIAALLVVRRHYSSGL